jgi:hypothetical protein
MANFFTPFRSGDYVCYFLWFVMFLLLGTIWTRIASIPTLGSETQRINKIIKINDICISCVFNLLLLSGPLNQAELAEAEKIYRSMNPRIG